MWCVLIKKKKYNQVNTGYIFCLLLNSVENHLCMLLNKTKTLIAFSNVIQFSRSVVSDPVTPGTAPTPGASSNPWPSSRWCRPTISSSVVPFSSCLQSFSASGSLPMSHFFASGGQSVGFQFQDQSFERIFRTDFL